MKRKLGFCALVLGLAALLALTLNARNRKKVAAPAATRPSGKIQMIAPQRKTQRARGSSRPLPRTANGRIRALLLAADSVEVETEILHCRAGKLGEYPLKNVKSNFVMKMPAAKILPASRDIKVTPAAPADPESCYEPTTNYSPFLGLAFDRNKKTLIYIALGYNSTELSYLNDLRSTRQELYFLHPDSAQRFRELVARHPKIVRALHKAGANPKYPGIKPPSLK